MPQARKRTKKLLLNLDQFNTPGVTKKKFSDMMNPRIPAPKSGMVKGAGAMGTTEAVSGNNLSGESKAGNKRRRLRELRQKLQKRFGR